MGHTLFRSSLLENIHLLFKNRYSLNQLNLMGQVPIFFSKKNFQKHQSLQVNNIETFIFAECMCKHVDIICE